jgi:hypothetical protein
MKKDNKISSFSQLTKQALKIKISNKLNTVADTPFFKKKMEKGAKTLAIAGLPK